jgi:TRAP-type uncharacterized transport system substrate-binding protein
LAGSNIRSYADLADKRIVPGKVGFSGEVLAKSILGVYGITYDSIKKKGGVVNYVGYADAAALMKDGHLDAYMAVTSCPQATIIDLNFRPGIRLLPVDKAHMKKFMEKYPGYVETVIPKDDMVYHITKAIFENLPELAKIKKKAIAEVSLENGLRGAMIPIHPGAKRYYDEHGVKVK